jgi:hypothetical protein
MDKARTCIGGGRAQQRGASMLQYVVMLGFVAVPALAAYAVAGPKIADNLVRIARSMLGIEETP